MIALYMLCNRSNQQVHWQLEKKDSWGMCVWPQKSIPFSDLTFNVDEMRKEKKIVFQFHTKINLMPSFKEKKRQKPSSCVRSFTAHMVLHVHIHLFSGELSTKWHNEFKKYIYPSIQLDVLNGCSNLLTTSRHEMLVHHCTHKSNLLCHQCTLIACHVFWKE